jgi:hypothetical protein
MSTDVGRSLATNVETWENLAKARAAITISFSGTSRSWCSDRVAGHQSGRLCQKSPLLSFPAFGSRFLPPASNLPPFRDVLPSPSRSHAEANQVAPQSQYPCSRFDLLKTFFMKQGQLALCRRVSALKWPDLDDCRGIDASDRFSGRALATRGWQKILFRAVFLKS